MRIICTRVKWKLIVDSHWTAEHTQFHCIAVLCHYHFDVIIHSADLSYYHTFLQSKQTNIFRVLFSFLCLIYLLYIFIWMYVLWLNCIAAIDYGLWLMQMVLNFVIHIEIMLDVIRSVKWMQFFVRCYLHWL